MDFTDLNIIKTMIYFKAFEKGITLQKELRNEYIFYYNKIPNNWRS